MCCSCAGYVMTCCAAPWHVHFFGSTGFTRPRWDELECRLHPANNMCIQLHTYATYAMHCNAFQCISMLYNKFNATPHHSVASCLLLSKLSSCRLIWICWIWAANTWHRNVGDVAQTWPTTCACDIYNQLERTWLLIADWLSWIAGPTLGIFFHSLTELTLMFLKKCATLCFQNLDFRKATWSNVEPKSCRAGYLYGANAKQCSIESYWIYMSIYICVCIYIYIYIHIYIYIIRICIYLL